MYSGTENHARLVQVHLLSSVLCALRGSKSVYIFDNHKLLRRAAVKQLRLNAPAFPAIFGFILSKVVEPLHTCRSVRSGPSECSKPRREWESYVPTRKNFGSSFVEAISGRPGTVLCRSSL